MTNKRMVQKRPKTKSIQKRLVPKAGKRRPRADQPRGLKLSKVAEMLSCSMGKGAAMIDSGEMKAVLVEGEPRIPIGEIIMRGLARIKPSSSPILLSKKWWQKSIADCAIEGVARLARRGEN